MLIMRDGNGDAVVISGNERMVLPICSALTWSQIHCKTIELRDVSVVTKVLDTDRIILRGKSQLTVLSSTSIGVDSAHLVVGGAMKTVNETTTIYYSTGTTEQE